MDSLPLELLLAICAYLDEVTLVRLSGASRSLRDGVLDPRMLTVRFSRLPLSYSMRVIARDLLQAPEVSRTEILRFIADSKRAVALYNEVAEHNQETPVSYIEAYSTIDVDEDKCWHLFWAACSLDNVYLARSFYLAHALQRAHRCGESGAIYFDLLFRHGLWATAAEDLSCILSGSSWEREQIPQPYRDSFFDDDTPHYEDVAGFRRVYGIRTIFATYPGMPWSGEHRITSLILSPHIPIATLAETLRAEFASGPHYRLYPCVSFALRARCLRDCTREEFSNALSAQGYRNLTSFLFGLMREGKWHEDTSVLIPFLET